MPTDNNKRKTIINDKPFQFGLLYKLGLINLLMIGLLSILFFIIAQDIVSTLIIKHGIELSDSSNVLVFKNLPFTVGYFIVFISFLILQSVLTLRITHRICGPMFSIKRKINEIRKGNLCGELVLRPKDYGTDLADDVNNLRSELSNRISDICIDIEELNELSVSVQSSLNDDVSDGLQNFLSKNEAIKKKLDYFQIETSI